MKKNPCPVLSLSLILVLLAVAGCGPKDGPSPGRQVKPDDALASTVVLETVGHIFTSGLRPDARGNPNGQGREIVEGPLAAGTGFFAGDDGRVLTNFHVINRATKIEVRFDPRTRIDPRNYQATLICTPYDPGADLAVLRLESRKGFTRAPLGSSIGVAPLSDVVAVGNSSGTGLNLAKGNVSQVIEKDGTLLGFVHTAIIEQGNSGGPLYHNQGVVGVNTLQVARRGFAVAIDHAQSLLDCAESRPLASVFDPRRIPDVRVQVQATTATVPAGTENPLALVVPDLPPGDYSIVVEAPPGADPQLVIVRPDNEPIGFGKTSGNVEEVYVAKSYVGPVGIVVFNESRKPIPVGVKVYALNW
jgi:S1-C subfamily serine protease